MIVNLDHALARDSASLRTVHPLRVTAGGLRLSGYPGTCTPRSAQYHQLARVVHLHRTQRQRTMPLCHGEVGSASTITPDERI